MRVRGIDFTSAPRRRKPVTCVECELDGDLLIARRLTEWADFDGFEHALQEGGSWIAGIDFPFGQASRFVETIGWPTRWADYVAHAHELGRAGFRAALDSYRAPRQEGDKEHRRRTDIEAGSISPQKLFGVPVGLMFYEGAARVLRSGVSVPSLRAGDPDRIVVEAYPGVLARQIIGRRSYKQDTRSKQTPEQKQARRDILAALRNGTLFPTYGLSVEAPDSLCDDPGGGRLDALLCAVQAAWSWRRRHEGFGAPVDGDPNEGWIADPTLSLCGFPHLIEDAGR